MRVLENPLAAHFEQGQHFHFEALLPAELFEYFHIARLPISKAKVRSHVDGRGVQWPDQNIPYELQGERWASSRVKGRTTSRSIPLVAMSPAFLEKGVRSFGAR